MKYREPKVVAELCANHGGDMDTAKRMIRMAEICGVDVCKLQKRDLRMQALSNPNLYHEPHPNPVNAFGETYLKHREALEFTIEQHMELKKYIESFGMEYSSSVWDVPSAIEIAALQPPFIKVPSACNQQYATMQILKEHYGGDIHISLGITDKTELSNLVSFWKGQLDRVVFYHCTTTYPLFAIDAHLLEITDLLRIGAKDVGFSNHHSGIALDLEAQALGASWFEHHVTLDRMSKGTDHIAALEFTGLRALVRDLKEGFLALKFKPEEECEAETIQRAKLKI